MNNGNRGMVHMVDLVSTVIVGPDMHGSRSVGGSHGDDKATATHEAAGSIRKRLT